MFGVIVSILLQNIIEKFNPERGARMVAREMKGHIVVVGYSHLGQRLINHFRKNGVSYSLIEKNADAVDELVRLQEPVVIDDAKEPDCLEDAGIRSARGVIIASNNLETALIVTKRARACNPSCFIVTRCFQDDFEDILETLGATMVISSSRNAFEDIVGKTAEAERTTGNACSNA